MNHDLLKSRTFWVSITGVIMAILPALGFNTVGVNSEEMATAMQFLALIFLRDAIK